MNTIITEINANGEEVSYDVYQKLVDNRILFLYDVITDDIATDIVATLLYLDNQDDSKKISLYINSPGGEISSVFMIYDTIKMINSPIETLCIGNAEREAVLIVSAGDKGMRYATKNSFFSLSQLVNHYDAQIVNMTNAEILLNKHKQDNEKFLKAVAKCSGKTYRKIVKDTERQFYLDTKEAVKYGIIDAIVGEKNV